MAKVKLDPRTLRAVVRRLRNQAVKCGNERARIRKLEPDNELELQHWYGSIAALHGMADHLLDEARTLERQSKGAKR